MPQRRTRACLAGAALLLALGAGRPAQAQTPEPTASPGPQTTAAAASPQPQAAVSSLEKQFLKNLLRDQKAIWTSPFHLRATDMRWFVPLAGGTAAFIATDKDTGYWIATYPELVDPSVAISYAGSGGTLTAAAATFYLIGRAAHNDRARETGLLGGEALIDSILVMTAIKTATQRARPDAGEDRSKFFVGGSSFPSGHASESWALATVIALEYRDKRPVQIAAYSVAALVSLSRFTAQRHYLSDVLVGSAIGYSIGRYVYRAHHVGDKGQAPSNKFPLIAPQYDRHARAYGVAVTWIY
jgi:membrane-associated phospholipid phosphatase